MSDNARVRVVLQDRFMPKNSGKEVTVIIDEKSEPGVLLPAKEQLVVVGHVRNSSAEEASRDYHKQLADIMQDRVAELVKIGDQQDREYKKRLKLERALMFAHADERDERQAVQLQESRHWAQLLLEETEERLHEQYRQSAKKRADEMQKTLITCQIEIWKQSQQPLPNYHQMVMG
eukprot:TRINITY_DN67781_c5_g9_i1.p1 TRINITY_DN67781_c5_g9~~TRINITY_DN67781_c5_g9_i1.p1  ORF type:complete len:176 (+),score=24.28 TRINITY_DN67781_c5_g9_i1:51-578(+)